MNALAKITDFADVYAGGGAPQNADDFSENGIPFLRAGSLPKLLNGAKESDLEKITNEVAKKHKLQLHKKGSVVFAKSGMSATKGHIYRLKDDCYVVNHLAVIKPNANCDSNYLEHALKKYSPTTLILDAAYPSIRLSDISDFKIPLPPIAQQQRIAAILDKAAEIKAKREQAIAKLHELAQSTFVEMFGDFEQAINYTVKPLSQLIQDTRLGLVRGATELDEQKKYAYMRMNAITKSGDLQLEKMFRADATDAEVEQYKLRMGDFLFNTRNSRELVGKTAIFDLDGLYLFNNNIMRIRFNELVNSVYVAASFQTKYVQRKLEQIKSGTTNVFAIYYKDLEKIEIPIPSITEQNLFAKKMDFIKKSRNLLLNALDIDGELINSLQHQAFTTGFNA